MRMTGGYESGYFGVKKKQVTKKLLSLEQICSDTLAAGETI